MPADTRAYLEALDFPLPPAASPPCLNPYPKPCRPPATVPASEAPIFVELFAGCARLSRHCHSAGFEVLAVDFPWNHHKPEHPLLVLDLTETMCQQQLLDRLLLNPPFAVHIALPCGTGSRARERPISKQAKLAGAPEPSPLRDADHILGLPGLSARDQTRVEQANRLCEFVVQLLGKLPDSCFVSIENPTNSWIWGVLAHYVRLSKDSGLLARWNRMSDVCFHNCMKGGSRPKQSRFRCTHDFLSSMAIECDGKHVHSPYLTYRSGGEWRFSTAEEAEYPAELCQEVAHLLATSAGLPPPLEPPSNPELLGLSREEAVGS